VPPVTDQGVCIRQRDWSETSQTAVVLAREHGLLRVLAKGSRRDKAPYSGGLEVLARADFEFIAKPAGQLALLTSWDLAETYPACRRELPRFHASMFLADLVGRAVQDADPHPKLHDALVGALRALDAGDPVERALLEFQWTLLVEIGHKPELRVHAGTGEPPQGARALGFSPELGGVVDDPGPNPGERTWRARTETIALLRRLEAGEIPSEDAAALERAGRLLAHYTRARLEIDPPTLGLVYPDPAARPAQRG